MGNESGVIAHGSFALPSTGDDIGTFLRRYHSWLSSAFSRWEPDEIVFEMPILGKATSLATLRKLYSLCGMTEYLAGNAHIGVSEANLFDIRRHFLGVATAPRSLPKAERRPWLKDQTVTKCRDLGFRPSDDDDADSIALFSFAMSVRVPGFVLAGTEIARAA